MEVVEIQPWLFQIEPLEGESLSHFLGRFRRANDLTPTGLGKATGLGGAIAGKSFALILLLLGSSWRLWLL